MLTILKNLPPAEIAARCKRVLDAAGGHALESPLQDEDLALAASRLAAGLPSEYTEKVFASLSATARAFITMENSRVETKLTDAQIRSRIGRMRSYLLALADNDAVVHVTNQTTCAADEAVEKVADFVKLFMSDENAVSKMTRTTMTDEKKEDLSLKDLTIADLAFLKAGMQVNKIASMTAGVFDKLHSYFKSKDTQDLAKLVLDSLPKAETIIEKGDITHMRRLAHRVLGMDPPS